MIAAMGVACGEFNIDKNYDYVSKLNSYAKDKLLKIDGVVLNSPENALPYVLNISAGKVRSETMLHFLKILRSMCPREVPVQRANRVMCLSL